MKKDDIIELVNDSLLNVVDVTKFQYIEDTDIGYFGRVNSNDFISYSNLCELLDFHKGALMDDNGWLLFWYKGSVLFISKHPVRYNLSWDDINKHNLVFGERSVSIDNNKYTIMLPTGGDEDDEGEGSMWNDLIYKVHKKYGIWDKLSGVDLNIKREKCPVGTSSWCQEHYGRHALHRTCRGGVRLEYTFPTLTTSNTDAHYGARLVLKKDYI